jgi:hypothetical protein
MTDRLSSQPLATIISTVDRLSPQPLATIISAVIPTITSAVTDYHLSRWLTAEMPLKGGYSGGFTRGDSNLSGSILQFDYAGRLAASSAPGARALESSGVLVHEQVKNSKGSYGR